MEQNLGIDKSGIKTQIKELYGKLTYSYTTHIKASRILTECNSRLKLFIVILSAISTCGLVSVIIWDERWVAIVTTLITAISLVLSTHLKSFDYDQKISSHRNTAHGLWKLRERFISYLTDFDTLSASEIIKERDLLIEELANIYETEPLTSSKAYKLAQKALKNEEEQFFSEAELNKLLPKHLRSK